MAYEILSESYGRRLPKITATAESADDLTSLGTDYAEGSICTISDKTYTLDKVQGWIEAGSGGGGGGGVFWVNFTVDAGNGAADKTAEEVYTAAMAGQDVRGKYVGEIVAETGSGSEIVYYDLYRAVVFKDQYSAEFVKTGYSTVQSDTQAAGEMVVINNDNTLTYTFWAWDVQDDS